MYWKSRCKSAFALTVFVLLCGNFVSGRAQARPESVPFDAARFSMQPASAQGVAIRAGRLFDPRTGDESGKPGILIQGERITDVGYCGPGEVPAGMRVIDLSSATVLPGLIDRHVHLMQNQDRRCARPDRGSALRAC